jgi:uroporphyrin-III C-methyltransferase
MKINPRGKVILVGAGPGAADLITVRGLRALQAADVILYDNLIDHTLLDGLTAELVYVGKRCGAKHSVPQGRTLELLAAHALAGRTVVRLKGGDSTVLGRGGEEALHLAGLGIEVSMVPGVSNAIAAPELAGIPVTHRGIADSFCVVSAHRRNDELDFSLPPYHPRTTVVVLMGVRTLPVWRRQLFELGYPRDTPIAFITDAGGDRQRRLVSTLEAALEDASEAGLRTPTTAVVGGVVRLCASTHAEVPLAATA